MRMEPEPAFIIGMMFGALLLWAAQHWLARRRERREATAATASVAAAARSGDDARRLREIEELHQRLAVLERIATDPAERTAAEIDRLR
jgi:flagellar motility protein MotE (MotC chaperone)